MKHLHRKDTLDTRWVDSAHSTQVLIKKKIQLPYCIEWHSFIICCNNQLACMDAWEITADVGEFTCNIHHLKSMRSKSYDEF